MQVTEGERGEASLVALMGRQARWGMSGYNAVKLRVKDDLCGFETKLSRGSQPKLLLQASSPLTLLYTILNLVD